MPDVVLLLLVILKADRVLAIECVPIYAANETHILHILLDLQLQS